MYPAVLPRDSHGGLCCARSASAAASMHVLVVGLREVHTCCSQELSEPARLLLGCCLAGCLGHCMLWSCGAAQARQLCGSPNIVHTTAIEVALVPFLRFPAALSALSALPWVRSTRRCYTASILQSWFTEFQVQYAPTAIDCGTTCIENEGKKASCNQLVKALLHASMRAMVRLLRLRATMMK